MAVMDYYLLMMPVLLVELFTYFYMPFFVKKENGNYQKKIAYPVHAAGIYCGAKYIT
jgi:hypothetical protein